MPFFSSCRRTRKRPKVRPGKRYQSSGDVPISPKHATRPDPQGLGAKDGAPQLGHENKAQIAIPPKVQQQTFNQRANRASLTSSLEYALNPNRSLSQCDFIYDIVISTDATHQIYRRLVMDFKTDYNVMADDVQKKIDTKLQPYYGDVIQIPGRRDVKPIGLVTVNWRLHQGVRVNTTTFLVIRDSEFDVLLGRPSVEEHDLFRTDPEIARRLEHSKKSIPMRSF